MTPTVSTQYLKGCKTLIANVDALMDAAWITPWYYKHWRFIDPKLTHRLISTDNGNTGSGCTDKLTQTEHREA